MKRKMIPLLGIAVFLAAAGGMKTEAAAITGSPADVTISETESGWYGNLKFHIPDSWTGHFYMGHHTDADGTYWTEFCEEPDFSGEGTGWLCSVIQVKDNDVEKYKYLPSFDYIGEIRCDNGETYGRIVEYPTDVQPSIDQMELYGRMYEDIKALVNNIEVGRIFSYNNNLLTEVINRISGARGFSSLSSSLCFSKSAKISVVLKRKGCGHRKRNTTIKFGQIRNSHNL